MKISWQSILDSKVAIDESTFGNDCNQLFQKLISRLSSDEDVAPYLIELPDFIDELLEELSLSSEVNLP